MIIKKITTQEEIKELQDFARTFGHAIAGIDLTADIFAFYNDNNEMLGYFQAIWGVVAFPAFHPLKSDPRTTIEAIKMLTSYSKVESAIRGQPIYGFVALTDGSEPSLTTPEFLSKLGLHETKKVLYAVKTTND